MVRPGKLIGALSAVAVFVAPAMGDEPTTKELLEQIKQLQAKVEQLEVKQAQTSADVAATVQKVFEDAQKRSQLISSNDNVIVGHEDNHFFLKSADGNYLFIPRLMTQIRNTTNYNTDGDDIQNGFEIRRLKLRFEGNVITPDLTYAFQWAFAPNTGSPSLEDAWVQYKFLPDWSVRAGQFQDPLLHEQLVSGFRQLAADRSLLTLQMTGSSDNFVQGVGILYDKEKWRAAAAFTDGIGSQNTTWQDYPTTNADFGAVGRIEYFAKGNRNDYRQFTSLGNKSDLLVFGVASDVTQAGSTTAWIQTADAQWADTNGYSAYGAYVGRLTDFSDGNEFDWGLQIQGSKFLTTRCEAFVRYDFIYYGEPVVIPGGGSENLFNEFTLGMNYYVHGQAAKFTVDFTYLPDGSPSNQVGLGELQGDSAQFLLRAQFQLLL